MGADGSSFFNGLCCLGLIPMKFHAQFPVCSLPTGIYGWFSGQQLLQGFVGLLLEFTHVSVHPVNLTSSRALTWDKVSTGLGSSFNLWGGGVSTATGFGLFGVEFTDPWPDMSNITWTPYFHGHADLSFQFRGSGLQGAGYNGSGVFANGQCLLIQLLYYGLQDVNFQVDGSASS